MKEHRELEFKESITNTFLKTVSAFANYGSGKIIFGISDDVAAQMIGVGFIIGILQDSTETALNSSTDVLFTAAVCMEEERKNAA